MDAIDLLEKRISALELQTFPENYEVGKNQVVTDLLLQSHTMISSALSCRDNIISILDRMPKLNEYLDPNYANNHLDLETRKQYVLELYPELMKTAELIKKFNGLKLFIDSPQIVQMTNLAQRLEKVTVENIDIYRESKSLTDQILHWLNQYNEIALTIKLLFAELDNSISEIEASLQMAIKTE